MSAPAWAAALAAATAIGCALGCSSPAPLGGAGAACSVVTDCQDGLVCAPESKSAPLGAHVCTSNPSALVPQQPPPADAAAGPPATIPDIDAGVALDDAASAPEAGPDDATAPIEASPPPPVDAAPPRDAAPARDAGNPHDASPAGASSDGAAE